MAWIFLGDRTLQLLGFGPTTTPGGDDDDILCLIIVGAFIGLQISADLLSRWRGKIRRRSSWQFTFVSACSVAVIVANGMPALFAFRTMDQKWKDWSLLYHGIILIPAVVWFAVNVMRFGKAREDTVLAR